MKRYVPHHYWKLFTAALIALLAGGWLAVQPAVAAADLDKLDTSLKLIPTTAAFYSSMLRNREQIETILHSKAWAKIMSMPSVQMGIAMFEAQAQQPGTPAAQGMAALENPETKKLIDLLIDMTSNEIFMYGDENFSDFTELLQSLVSAMRYRPAILQVTGESESINPNELQAKVLLEAMLENLDLVAFPDLVIGFRLNNPAAANEALIKLETILNLSLEAQPALKGHFKKEKIGDHEFLVLKLDGKMIPWDELPLDEWKQLVEEESDWEKIIAHIKEMEFVFALGVRDNYLLVSLGSSLDGLKNLGATQRLIDRPEFASLKKFIDQRFLGIGYISKELNQQLNNNAKQIDDLFDFLGELLPLANLTEEQNEQIQKDAETFVEDVKSALPELGPVMGFSFLSGSGIEGYQYAWGDHSGLNGSQSLGLLKHMGGNPILGVVSRSKTSLEEYDKMVKWVKVGCKYAEDFLLPNIPGEDGEKAKAFFQDFVPLVERLNAVTRDMLIPALADGQIGLVIDGKLKSRQLHQSLPALDNELPMIEPALVLGVSDAALLRKAVSEMYALANEFIALIRKHQPDAIPPVFKLPQPKELKQPEGAIFAYALPEEWGVDKNIVPNAGLSTKVAVLSLSTNHTDRLLKEMPLKVGGVLANTDTPLAIAGWLDWAELVKAATPWVVYALENMTDEQLGGQKESVIGQVRTVLEVLQVFKSFTSESYLEDDCLVSHSMLEIHDLSN